MSKTANPYGDGYASKRIVDAIVDKYSKKNQKLNILKEDGKF